jgi:hypothetical protein
MDGAKYKRGELEQALPLGRNEPSWLAGGSSCRLIFLAFFPPPSPEPESDGAFFGLKTKPCPFV